jgi:GDSL-like Lipase/Acylhydrolase family
MTVPVLCYSRGWYIFAVSDTVGSLVGNPGWPPIRGSRLEPSRRLGGVWGAAMASSSPVTQSWDEEGHGGESREWRPRHLIWLALAAIVLFVVVFWAALGKPPLSGTTVVAVLGFAFIVFANLALGALATGAVIEYQHPDWSRLRGVDHVFMYIALASLVAADAGVAWWLFSSDTGGFTRWLFLIFALAGMAGGAWWAWPAMPLPYRRHASGGRSRWALWPQHDKHAPDDQTWHLFTPLTILLGAALGVAVAGGYLGISAWHENSSVPAGHPMPAAVAGSQGSYVALGDSYSAGEGLVPFAPGTAVTNCDRSVSSAYPYLLFKRLQGPPSSFTFTACSGALVSEILKSTHRAGGLVPPQVSGKIEPSVGLVTLTIGGNNAIFSKIVLTCMVAGNCLGTTFPPPGTSEATAKRIPPGKLVTQWGPATIEEIGEEDAAVFHVLRRDFPNARIVVIGYPYLFPSQSEPGFPFFPPECASILNRLSGQERAGIRTLQDEFNDRTYEEAAASGIEFVSPVAIWDGHEPCGASGQYTNSVKPYLNFPNPVNGGSFHPNAAGQQTLAALMACYLDEYHQPPDPFAPGAPHVHAIPLQLVSPPQLHMRPAPGLNSVPGSRTIPGC